MLARPQQEIAEEKWPGQAMRLSGLEPANPVEVGAHPLVKPAVAALSSGLQMPSPLCLAPLFHGCLVTSSSWGVFVVQKSHGAHLWGGRTGDADVLCAVSNFSMDLDEVHD